jgi:hypothetical protein
MINPTVTLKILSSYTVATNPDGTLTELILSFASLPTVYSLFDSSLFDSSLFDSSLFYLTSFRVF